jgi:hypothetical protein
MTFMPFGNFQPDLPAIGNPGALQAKNCLPKTGSYGPFKALSAVGGAITGNARGSYWAIHNAVKYNFAADATKLYLYDNASAWTDVSRPATTYSADFWDFISFQNRVIATDGGSGPLQYFDMGVSTDFDNLPGSPPLAKVISVVRDFLVCGNYEIGAEIEPGGIAWSGFNNTALWTPSLATQSGRRPTRGAGGDVVRIIGGSQGMVFRNGAILLMRYAGPPNIWQFDDVTTLHGTPSGRSVAWSRDLAFYYSEDGFQQLDRASLKITPIGHGAVNDYFLDNCAPSEVFNVHGAVDRANSLVYWAFRSSSSSVPFNRMLVYNWIDQRWAYAEIDVEMMGEFVNAGFNLDTIGAVLGGNIDSASINVDSLLYTGGALSFIGFDAAHIAGTFTGAALTAEIDTGEREADETHRTMVNGVKPRIEGNSSTVVSIAPVTRNLPTSNPVQGTFAAVNAATGQADMRINARYMRYRVRIAGGFTHASGVTPVSAKRRGRR